MGIELIIRVEDVLDFVVKPAEFLIVIDGICPCFRLACLGIALPDGSLKIVEHDSNDLLFLRIPALLFPL